MAQCYEFRRQYGKALKHYIACNSYLSETLQCGLTGLATGGLTGGVTLEEVKAVAEVINQKICMYVCLVGGYYGGVLELNYLRVGVSVYDGGREPI